MIRLWTTGTCAIMWSGITRQSAADSDSDGDGLALGDLEMTFLHR
jgi:hypothetical protein